MEPFVIFIRNCRTIKRVLLELNYFFIYILIDCVVLISQFPGVNDFFVSLLFFLVASIVIVLNFSS